MVFGYNLNGPEYEARLKKPFSPPTVTLKEIHDAVPKHLLKKDPIKAAAYVARDITFTLLLFKLASLIGPWADTDFSGFVTSGWNKALLKTALWCSYYWIQGMVWAGIFCLGHDAGHGTLFEDNRINNVVGFVLHTWLLIPYYAWRSTHHAHHKATASMERDENYVPYLRSEYDLPSEKKATQFDYAEVFEETPIWTFARMFIMQGFGWWVYLTKNTMGSKMYPPGTNHFDPHSPLFKPEQRNSIIISNIALTAMLSAMAYAGPNLVLKYYLVPYLLTNHWIVMFTYLHHSDPTIPHYRKAEWSFLRGAAATVDRPLLGWCGRFFFHNISHDHVAHHFFIKAPFYNGPQITKAIKTVLKDDYNYDSTPTWYALYRSFTQCLFVEEEGNIIFYKNRHGVAARELARGAMKKIHESGWNGDVQDSSIEFPKLD
ncbi:Delta(12) fatty acid desaturase [Termitomyces sp. T112]|nr:Delta(12) fatty acid desaturase [Termitomyces sp. T112]